MYFNDYQTLLGIRITGTFSNADHCAPTLKLLIPKVSGWEQKSVFS